MDVITLLKIEHGILRVRFEIVKDLISECEAKAFTLLEETHNFIVRWHAMIEDKYVFPFYGEKAKPLSHDHLLIEKYGNSVLKERRKDWVERYIKIVLEHNLNEENLLFKDYVNIPLSEIRNEVDSFKDYSKITGLDLSRL